MSLAGEVTSLVKDQLTEPIMYVTWIHEQVQIDLLKMTKYDTCTQENSESTYPHLDTFL